MYPCPWFPPFCSHFVSLCYYFVCLVVVSHLFVLDFHRFIVVLCSHPLSFCSLCGHVACLCGHLIAFICLTLHEEVCALYARSVIFYKLLCWCSLSTAQFCKSPSFSSMSHWKRASEPVLSMKDLTSVCCGIRIGSLSAYIKHFHNNQKSKFLLGLFTPLTLFKAFILITAVS